MRKARITIDNTEGIRRADLLLEPGVNVLTGRNGAGKSSAMRAATRLAGGDVTLSPFDGQREGTVEGLGVRLVVRKTTRATGTADLSLADTHPLGDLIDPGIKDAERANTARLRALARLSRLPVSDEAVNALAPDPEVAAEATRQIRDQHVSDLLQASEAVRLVAHRLKRQEEDVAREAAATASVATVEAGRLLEAIGGEERLSETPGAEAEAKQRDLERQLAEAALLAGQRVEHEKKQAEIRATIGERPDPSRYDAPRVDAEQLAVLRDAEVDRIRREIRELERSLQDAVAAQMEARAAVRAVNSARQAEAERLLRWTAQARLLDAPAVGPGSDEVDALKGAVEAARAATRAAQQSDAYRKAKTRAGEARLVQEERTKRAGALEDLATSVGERLGQLLSGTAASGLTVVNGRLCAVDDAGQVHDFELRRSNGQRIRAALKVALRAYPGGIVPLEDRHWAALDPDAREELAAIARELGLIVLTEEPGRGDLALQHLPGDLFNEGAAA